MGLLDIFDTSKQQDQARTAGREAFMAKARTNIMRKLIERNIVKSIPAPNPINPALPGDEKRYADDLKKAQAEEAKLLALADKIIDGTPAMYDYDNAGNPIDLGTLVPEDYKKTVKSIKSAADEFGEEAANSVRERTGFMSMGFWMGLLKWIFTGCGLLGGLDFMQCQ